MITTSLLLSLYAMDRITFADGQTIQCKITKQTKEEITYVKDGKETTVRKSDIYKTELDIEEDKFYKAAAGLRDTDKRIKYLAQSMKSFPDQDYN